MAAGRVHIVAGIDSRVSDESNVALAGLGDDGAGDGVLAAGLDGGGEPEEFFAVAGGVRSLCSGWTMTWMLGYLART